MTLSSNIKMFDFIKNISSTELIIIILILVVLFGGKSIAKRVARTSGETAKEIKNIKKEFTKALDDDNEPTKN